MASINQFGDFGATTNSVCTNIPKGRSSSVGEMSVVVGPVDVFGAGAGIGAIGKSLDPSFKKRNRLKIVKRSCWIQYLFAKNND